MAGAVVCGMNERCRQTVDVLARAMLRAAKWRADAFVILGDVFDTAAPLPQMVAAVQAGINAARAVHPKLHVLALVGNHDQVSEVSGDHALAPLADHAQIVDAPRVWSPSGSRFLAAHPYVREPPGEWLLPWCRGPAKRGGPPTVLCVHFGIFDESTAPCLRNAKDSSDVGAVVAAARAAGARFVLAGNWHARRYWTTPEGDVEVLQVGALVPTGFDNEGESGYGGLAYIDTVAGTLEIEELDGPRFLKFKTLSQLRGFAKRAGLAYYLSVEVTQGDVPEALRLLDELRSQGHIVDGEVYVDREEVADATRAAAQASRSAGSVDEAVASYISEMSLDAGVDRAAVLELVNRLRLGAAVSP